MRHHLRAGLAALVLLALGLLALASMPAQRPLTAQGAGEPPSACGVAITETAPASVRVCQELPVTVTLQVTRPQALPLHVVVLLAKHLLMFDHLDEAKRAAREMVDGLAFTEDTQVGLVTLSAQSRTELALTNQKSSVLSAINRVKLDQVRPEARYYDWLAEAEDLLAEARDEAVSPVEIIVLISTGCPTGFESYCNRQKASSSRVQGKGVTIVGVCNPRAIIPPPALPANHCTDIRTMASAGSYYDLNQASRAAARLQELEREGKAVEPRELVLTELLAPGFRYVNGSGVPEPKVNAQRLVFEWGDLAADRVVTASYRLQPEVEGLAQLRPEGSTVVVADSLGRLSQPRAVPTRTIEVLPCAPPTPSTTPSPTPSASPTPSPTAAASDTPTASPSPSATASASPSATSVPGTVYLPLLLRRVCQAATQRSDIVLLIDTSSSMDQPMGAGSRLDAARGAAAAFIELVELDAEGDGDRVALLRFDAEARVAQDLTDDRASLRAALDGLETGSGTRIDRAIDQGLATLRGGREPGSQGRIQPVLVLLTDGQPDGGSEASTLDAAGRARALGIELYAVGFGDGVSADFLRRLASRPENYLAAPDAEELRAVYEAIAVDLPCPGGQLWPPPGP